MKYGNFYLRLQNFVAANTFLVLKDSLYFRNFLLLKLLEIKTEKNHKKITYQQCHWVN